MVVMGVLLPMSNHERDCDDVLPLTQAVDADCREFRGGHVAVCAILGEPYGPYQKRISTSYPEHHLRLEDFERVAELVQGPRVRAWFERVYGVTCYGAEPVAATRDAMLALSHYLQAEAGFVASLAEGAADGRWEAKEVADLERHGMKLVRQLLGIMAGARAAMEGRQHG